MELIPSEDLVSRHPLSSRIYNNLEVVFEAAYAYP